VCAEHWLLAMQFVVSARAYAMSITATILNFICITNVMRDGTSSERSAEGVRRVSGLTGAQKVK
jgi:hypothetical protein